MKRRKGYFSISAVAKMFSVHQQTIRLYEKEGLIAPKRSEGNTRLFSEEDVDKLEEIIYLTHKVGVNLAGVEIILKMQKKIQKLQDDMNKLFAQTQGQMESETAEYKKELAQNVQKLHAIKKSNVINALDLKSLEEDEEEEEISPKNNGKSSKKENKSSSKDEWNVEFED